MFVGDPDIMSFSGLRSNGPSLIQRTPQERQRQFDARRQPGHDRLAKIQAQPQHLRCRPLSAAPAADASMPDRTPDTSLTYPDSGES